MSKDPKSYIHIILNTLPAIYDSFKYGRNYKDNIETNGIVFPTDSNPLTEYFENHKEGLGIFKWQHYFDVYHRHFAKFVGKKVNILEIGIFSGGSLEMWKTYFGDKSMIYGVDIEESCKTYERDGIKIYIGDQEDRSFWKKFKEQVTDIDIIIDDGGHTAEQQQVTLEEMLPVLNAGGVYVCEDVQRHYHRFTAFACGLVDELNHLTAKPGSRTRKHSFGISKINPFDPFLSVYDGH